MFSAVYPAAKVMLHTGIQSQKWLRNIKLQLYFTFQILTYFVQECICWLYDVHMSSSRGLRDRERKKHLSRGKETLVRSSGTAAVKYFIACSPTLIDTYIRPPVLPKQHLEMPQATAFPLSSVSLSVLLPHSSVQPAAALWLSPLSTSLFHRSHLSSGPSHVSLFFM